MEDKDIKGELIEGKLETITVSIPPVYSRELKLFGCVVWSDTRKLDEDAFYDRVTSRINSELAKEVMTLRALKQR